MTQMNKISKSKLTLLLMALLFAGFSMADEVKYSDSWGKHGFELTNQKSNGVEINYSINSFTIDQRQINGELIDRIEREIV